MFTSIEGNNCLMLWCPLQFPHKKGSSVRAHVLFMLFVFVVHSGVKHVLIIRVTWRVSFKRQELLALLEHKSSPPGFFFWRLYLGEPVLLIFFFFFCVGLLCVFKFWVPCCDVRYDVCIQTIPVSSLSPVVCRRGHVL